MAVQVVNRVGGGQRRIGLIFVDVITRIKHVLVVLSYSGKVSV